MNRFATSALALTTLCLLSACSQGAAPASAPTSMSGDVTTGGSSTLSPLTSDIGDRFMAVQPGVKVTTQSTSTGEGFKAFCAGRLDVANASRPIEQAEMDACGASGVKYTEILAANDAISIIVNKNNKWATCLTTAELKKLWEPAAAGNVSTWNQVRDTFPAEKLALFGPDSTSGTLDLFTTKITGPEKALRSDYTGSLDDHETIKGVNANPGGVGFLGLSYVVDNPDLVKPVAVDNGAGCVPPSSDTVRDGSYAPLSRPLYVYVNNAAVKDKPQVRAFMEYYVQWARNVAIDSNFVPVTESQRAAAKKSLAEAEGA